LLFKTIKKLQIGTQEGNEAHVKIESVRASDLGKYICYGFNPDRSAYDVTSIDLEFGNSNSSRIQFNRKISNLVVVLFLNSNRRTEETGFVNSSSTEIVRSWKDSGTELRNQRPKL
jgi:hypothetical protein